MSKREAFLLRTDPKVLEALRRWADDELRSANAQLDFVLRSALRRAGRLGTSPPKAGGDDNAEAESAEASGSAEG